MHIRESRERVLFCLRSLLLGEWPLGENPASTSLPNIREPSTFPHVGNLDSTAAPDHLRVMEECEAPPPEPSTSPHVGDLDSTPSTAAPDHLPT